MKKSVLLIATSTLLAILFTSCSSMPQTVTERYRDPRLEVARGMGAAAVSSDPFIYQPLLPK